MKTRLFGPSFLFFCAACAGAGETRPPAARPAPPTRAVAKPAAGPLRCPASVDARELLARHARAFGSRDAITSALPLTMHGDVAIDGKHGAVDVVLATDAFRSTTTISGVVAGLGIDRDGSWQLPMGAGVVERLTGAGEDSEAHFEGWMLRRGYVDATPDRVVCTDEPSGARVDLVFAVEPLASPTLSFDLASASLVAASHRQSDGRIERTTFEGFHDPDERGVRWPRKATSHPATGSPATVTYEPPKPTTCGDDCKRAPRSPFAIAWPASGRARVPLTFMRRSLFVRASTGGRDVDALLDSGASITVVDATTPAGQAFVPAFGLEGASSTQKIKVGVGTLPSIALGALTASDVPVASVPIPALDAMGKRRPELILGYSFFASSVVRIDYKKAEIVLAPPGTALHARAARTIPLRVAGGKLLAQATIEGKAAWFEIDTGDTGALDLYKKWEIANGLPGDRPMVAATGRFGAGSQETTARFFRLKTASLGPIAVDGALVHDGDPPDPGEVAGLAGNGLFARCDAVVIDHHARTLYVEGKCDRRLPENLMMWRFAKKPDPARPESPWVVDLVVPGSSVERAKIAKGDRIVSVAGKAVVDDLAPLESIETQPEGTRVPVVLVRDGKTERVVVELRRLLP